MFRPARRPPGISLFFGVWEPVITKYVADNLREGDVFIDVGADMGYYTILASRCVGASGKVFAVEASGGTYAKLLKNMSAIPLRM